MTQRDGMGREVGGGVQDGEYMYRLMSGHESRGSAGEYQADEGAGVPRLSWPISGRCIYTPGCKTASSKLLYSTGSSARCSVMT